MNILRCNRNLIKMNLKRVLCNASIAVLILFMACDENNDPELPHYENINSTEEESESINSEDYRIQVTDAMTENKSDHEDSDDYTWNTSEIVDIIMEGYNITINGPGASDSDGNVMITSAGTYNISGKLNDGQIIVNTADDGVVQLLLDGTDIHCSDNAPLYVINAEKTIIVILEGTENTISDGETYVFENADEDEPNAAVFSKDDLTICGKGTLTVNASYNDAITGKDGMIIAGGTLNIHSVDDGIRGKDYLIIKDGNIIMETLGDGLKSDNEDDATCGYILIEKGIINITAGGDAMQAETDVLITDGEITIYSGGGYTRDVNENTSAKGIKAVVNTIIEGGVMTVDAADDAIHSNGNMAVNGGVFNIITGDDGFHADEVLSINNGDITITNCYEGIESKIITVSNGDIYVHSNDDGLNVAGGNDESGMPGQMSLDAADNYFLYIEGGDIILNTAGDGIDANGYIEMSGGNVLVHGPVENMNGAIDYEGYFRITGGFLLAAGSSGMAQAPGTTSTQNSLLLNFSTQQAGTLVHVQTNDGGNLFTFSPIKQYQSIAFSSSELLSGGSYEIYFGGSSTGTSDEGLYLDGDYSPGSLYESFTVNSVLTQLGNTAFQPPGGR